MLKRIAMLFAMLALFAGLAVAQNGAFAPYVQGSVSYSANQGQSNPSFNGGLGIESSTNALLLDLNGTFATANPADSELNLVTVAGRGFTGTIAGSAYLKVTKHLLAGVGGSWAVTHADFESVVANGLRSVLPKGIDATLESAHPYVGGGFQIKRDRLLVTYALPGKDALTNERIVPVSNELFLTKHLRLTQNVTFTSYSGNPALTNLTIPFNGVRVSAVSASAGVKFVL